MSATETAVAAPKKTPVAIGNKGIVLADMDGLVRFSTAVAASGLAPKGIQSETAIFVAIQMGLEVGLTPMAALQNIAVINGRPSIWGDAQLAIVRGTGQLEKFDEWFEAGGKRLPRNPADYTDDTAAVCHVQRQGYPPIEVGFSVADARRAGLWNKDGPWKQYPFRMLRSRARSFALRDTFGDALKGILSGEEAQDLNPAIEVQATVAQPAAVVTRRPKVEVAAEQVEAKAPKVETKPEPPKAMDTDTLAAFQERNGIAFDDLLQWLEQRGTPTTATGVDEIPQAIMAELTPAELRKCALLKGKTPEGLV